MGCEGEPIELQDYMPPELQELRKKIAAFTGGKLGQTATAMPEGMPLSAPVNQLQLNAAQMMNQLMGAGQFSMPPYRTSGGMGSSGGGGDDSRYRRKSGPATGWSGKPTTNPEDLSGIYSLQNVLRGTQSLSNLFANKDYWGTKPGGPGESDPMAALWQAAMRMPGSKKVSPYLPSNYT